MRYEFRHEEKFLLIKLSGAASANERLLARSSLLPRLQASYGQVIIDLSDIQEGSDVLGILNMIKKEVEVMGGELRLCRLGPNLYRHFKINRLDRAFDIVQSVEEAKQSFKENSNEN